jgi:hypothetical protein
MYRKRLLLSYKSTYLSRHFQFWCTEAKFMIVQAAASVTEIIPLFRDKFVPPEISVSR